MGARLAAAGIGPDRVEFRGFSSHRSMLGEYNEVDVVLDTFPYNGGITTLEAMWMGRPVVTIRGDTMISRQGAALLEEVGLGELAADDAAGFARIVRELVSSPARLASIASGLRARMTASPLMDAPGMARALEEAYRVAWRDFVATAPRRI